MPLVESAAAGVLPAHADRDTLLHQATESERLGHAVIDIALARTHLGALFKELFDLGMDMEVRRIARELAGEFGQLFARHARFLFVLDLVPSAEVGVPIARQIAHGWFARDRTGVFLSC